MAAASEVGEFKFKNEGIASGGLAFGKERSMWPIRSIIACRAFTSRSFKSVSCWVSGVICGYDSGSGEGEFNHPKDIVTDSKG